MQILEKILGSSARVKIMRLFLLNRGKSFDVSTVGKRSLVQPEAVRREIRLLSSVGFIKRRGRNWAFNSGFKYGTEFEGLLLGSGMSNEEILEHFKKAGRIKLLIVSGVFIKHRDSRVDMLIVGNKLNKRKIEEAMRKIEAEIGVELAYAIFETKEFLYRLDMYDKLVRDVLDYPHEVVLESKELSAILLKKA